ncbi:MAG: diphosphomevalonate decarboxylase [Myxococcota bacterium]|jgi:diphosphomevalonate decarboxylase|nr:diphosphomevalonate decarboxylase [Myxococcota bacterium]
MTTAIRVRALANLALVKYFGKRDARLNLPAGPSLSLTLEPLETVSELSLDASLDADEVWLADAPASPSFTERVTKLLDIVRQAAGDGRRARLKTRNSFPTAAGLASSASGMAALALAACKAYGLELSSDELSALARRGSGSAARSVCGGIVAWYEGVEEDGRDSIARTLLEPGQWDLRVVVGLAASGPKEIGSTVAMERTRTTSPYYGAWLRAVHQDFEDALAAVGNKDFTALGEIAERSALSMHAAALAARPGIAFWNAATVSALHLCRSLRKSGVEAYFTCDAGPQPKFLVRPEHQPQACQALRELPGIEGVIECHLGKGALLLP